MNPDLASNPNVDALLEAARGGSREAFSRITEQHRRELLVHCYRMLGSTQDAEDQVQETMLKAWHRLDTFEGRAPFRAWLYKIATNACLDELARRPRRGLPMDFADAADPTQPLKLPVADPIWLEPVPDRWLGTAPSDPAARFEKLESITLAFMVALHRLPPRQRAVLLLRDVLNMRAGEVADLIESSVSAVHSALYRARSRLNSNYAVPEQDSVSNIEAQLERYVQAWETADIDGLIALLREDAVFPMPPLAEWVQGKSDIREFILRNILDGDSAGRWRLVPVRASGSPAFAWYRRLPGEPHQLAFAIQVLTVRGGLVASATTFGFPELFSTFGLPAVLPAA